MSCRNLRLRVCWLYEYFCVFLGENSTAKSDQVVSSATTDETDRNLRHQQRERSSYLVRVTSASHSCDMRFIGRRARVVSWRTSDVFGEHARSGQSALAGLQSESRVECVRGEFTRFILFISSRSFEWRVQIYLMTNFIEVIIESNVLH